MSIAAIDILRVYLFSTSFVLFAHSLKCDPLDNVFYHKQHEGCLTCKKCPVGLGKISLKEWGFAIDSINGPSSCIPCRPCKSGTYSDVRAYKCKPCTNCTQKNIYEVRSCSSREDAACDEQAPYPRTGPVKRNGSDNDDEGSTTSNSVSTIGIISIVLSVVVAFMLIIGFGWKVYRKRNGSRSTLHSAESGEYGSHNSCNYTPHQEDSISHMYNDELQGHGRESSSEDDEQTPLIPVQKQTHSIKRKRLLTYPFTEYSKEEDNLETDYKEIPNYNCDYRRSYPKLNIRASSHNEVGNSVLDSGFADFTLRGEPHLILTSFNIEDKRHVIEKVKEWDLKYKRSREVRNSSANSPHSFLRKYVNGQETILQKVKKWTEKEGLTSAFLSRVSRNLGAQYKFKSFAREAGLSDTDLANIQHNFKDDVVEQGYQVLLKLKQKEVINRERDVIDIMQTLGFTDIIAKIQQ